VVALWGPAEPVITSVYGERFGEAANATRMLLVGAVFAGLTQVVLVVLVSVGRQRIYPWVALGALALNIGLNAVLIPRLSYDGAAYATVFTEVGMFVAMWVLMARTVSARRLMPVGKLTLTAVLAIGICGVETVVAASTSLPRALVSVGAVAVFVLGAFALRIVDAGMIRSALPARSGRS
jgi:O-antigen/teichoic acid export membrane protein